MEEEKSLPFLSLDCELDEVPDDSRERHCSTHSILSQLSGNNS
ncbi:unnamed protein product [Arabidopsis lyrata]|nr:unnamed protein product [Arabidopsis lyrata]